MNEAVMLLIEWCAAHSGATWSIGEVQLPGVTLGGRLLLYPLHLRARLTVPAVPDLLPGELGGRPQDIGCDVVIDRRELRDTYWPASDIIGHRLQVAVARVIRAAEEHLERLAAATRLVAQTAPVAAQGGCTPTRSGGEP